MNIETNHPMIHIKIFGVGGSKYLQILKILLQVKVIHSTPLIIEEVNDVDLIMAHNIDIIPALQINNHYYHHNLDKYSVADILELLQEGSSNY